MKSSLASSSLVFDIGIPNFGIYGFTTMRRYAVYKFERCLTLTFILNVDEGAYL